MDEREQWVWVPLERFGRQLEGPQKKVEPQGPASLSEMKFTCLKEFTDILLLFFFFFELRSGLLKKEKILLTEKD